MSLKVIHSPRITIAPDRASNSANLSVLQAELETQASALKAYDEQDFEKALQIYEVGHHHQCFIPNCSCLEFLLNYLLPPDNRRHIEDPHQHWIDLRHPWGA